MVNVMVKNAEKKSRPHAPDTGMNRNRNIKIILFLILSMICIFPFFVRAEVKINEFSPDSSPQTIELYNYASESADISGWYIDDDGGSSSYYTISPNTLLYPQSCLVISANLNLNKSTPDSIRLFDSSFPPTSSSAHLIDAYFYKGSPGQDYSYGRNPDGQDNWLVIFSSFGKYNANNQNCIIAPTIFPTPTPTHSPTPSPSNTPTSVPESYENILISEVMVYPDTGQQEWIEFYNNNEFEVFLENWFIDDGEDSGSAPKKITVTLPAFSYAVYDLTSSMFNNDGDSVRLLDFDKVQKDGFEYGVSKQNITYSRVNWASDSFCETDASKHVENTTCIYPANQPYAEHSTPTPYSINQSTPLHLQDYHTQVFSSTGRQETVSHSPSVLGDTTGVVYQDATLKTPSPLPHFSFLTVSYSILTIASVLIKIKNGL